MRTISQFLNALTEGKAPDWVNQAEGTVADNYAKFLEYEDDFAGMIYGTNTLPGHRDKDVLDLVDHGNYQLELVKKHCIGGAPYFSQSIAKAITLAKAYSCLHGGVPISGALFKRIVDAFESDKFEPLVPMHSSYSSGDVIPAAHWAEAIISWSRDGAGAYTLQPGEGMALINGAFAHVGVTANLCQEFRNFWNLYLETLKVSLTVMRADARAFRYPHNVERSWASGAAKYVSELLLPSGERSQDPVSVRTTLQCLEGMTSAAEKLFAETNYYLTKPTGNPLFFLDPAPAHYPSGSFLNPVLTISTGALIEAMLMAGWGSVQRMNHMLSGKYAGIPIDAATVNDPIGLIQWPKNAQSKLERIRRECGTRSFVSGSSTSYGIEDMWSFGLQTAQIAHGALSGLKEIISLELYCALYAANSADIKTTWGQKYGQFVCGRFCSERDATALAEALFGDIKKKSLPFIF